jgi:excisionase family DNA binding protein
MTNEEKSKALERLLRKCPDVLTIVSAAKWIHMSKNTIHALVKEGVLFSYKYRGSYLISKADLIDYLVATTDEEPAWEKRLKEIQKKRDEDKSKK